MYVQRNPYGVICAISHTASGDIKEFIEDDSADVAAFLAALKPAPIVALEESDQAMARVLEDVVNLLVDQGTIRFTDLPHAAQTKLLSRRELRVQRKGMNLLDDGDDLSF